MLWTQVINEYFHSHIASKSLQFCSSSSMPSGVRARLRCPEDSHRHLRGWGIWKRALLLAQSFTLSSRVGARSDPTSSNRLKSFPSPKVLQQFRETSIQTCSKCVDLNKILISSKLLLILTFWQAMIVQPPGTKWDSCRWCNCNCYTIMTPFLWTIQTFLVCVSTGSSTCDYPRRRNRSCVSKVLCANCHLS